MYFDTPGKENTAKTIEISVQAIQEYGIRHVVLATTTGYTAQCFPKLDNVTVVCIPHAYGFKEPGANELDSETIRQLQEKGFYVYAASHALSGAERGITGKFGGASPIEIIAHTLRFFGQGMKVCVEIATMAADGGLLPPNVPILAIGGTGRGADTAVIMRAAHANHILETKIDRILCKPLLP
ncbi:MAG: pyruvate kinase alpha/beta domain-containing protein [Oscillospiraceae bacterium]|nr:pyruvate kinase alpha/beta domain-containing protein [Oscillospiraceae bacterium]